MTDNAHGGHNMKNWYYTDTLWHKPVEELEKHKPSKKHMYRYKKWTVKAWTYATDNAQPGAYPVFHVIPHTLGITAQAYELPHK